MLGVFQPQYTVEFAFSVSRDVTQVIAQALYGSRSFEVDHHVETVFHAHKDIVRQCELHYDEFFPPCCLNMTGFVTDLWNGLS